MNESRTSRPVRPAGSPRLRRTQRGVALAISLVLLVAMTVVGIATLSGTRLNEKVTSNAQQKSVAFEVAESAIDTVWDPEDLIDSVDPDAPFNDPEAVPQDALNETLSTDFDQIDEDRDDRKTVDIDGRVTIRYCGEGSPVGSSLDADESSVTMAGALFDVNGVARINGSAARADHVQRGSIVRPRTGRTGKCEVRGTVAAPGA